MEEKLVLQVQDLATRLMYQRFIGVVRLAGSDELPQIVAEEATRVVRDNSDQTLNKLVWKTVSRSRDHVRNYEAKHALGLSTSEVRRNNGDRRSFVSLDVRRSQGDLSTRDDALSNILRDEVEQLLSKYPNQRAATAFRLTVFHGWTDSSVGEFLGVSASRVSQSRREASNFLQQFFKRADFHSD